VLVIQILRAVFGWIATGAFECLACVVIKVMETLALGSSCSNSAQWQSSIAAIMCFIAGYPEEGVSSICYHITAILIIIRAWGCTNDLQYVDAQAVEESSCQAPIRAQARDSLPGAASHRHAGMTAVQHIH
jgi:hypothetical protein